MQGKRTEQSNVTMCSQALINTSRAGLGTCASITCASSLSVCDSVCVGCIGRWNYAGLECYNSSGQAIPQYVQLLSRTYARAIAGVPISMAFNRTTGQFGLCYTLPASLSQLTLTGSLETTPTSQVTEIYHNPPAFYPNGVSITTSPNVVATVSGKLILVVPASGANPGDTACVSITATA